MISKFVERFMENKRQLRTAFTLKRPSEYHEIVEAVVKVIGSDDYGEPDATRITEIDHGDYQGTLLYVIAAAGYQPSKFWTMKVGYGSCSVCDTLQAIHGYDDETPTEEQLNQYETLALHLVQSMTLVGGEEA